MGRLALRQLLQRFEVAADEGLLLGTTPFLHLALLFNRIRDSIEPLREDQLHGSARCGVASECSGIVLGYSALERPARGPDVVAPVRTFEDVKPRSVSHCKTLSHRSRRGEDAAPQGEAGDTLLGSQDEANRYRVNSMNKLAGLRETKMAPERRHFVFWVGLRRSRYPRLPFALSARRSIGSTMTFVPTLTRE